jgi:glutamine synthetase
MVMSGDRLSETKTRMHGMLSLEDLRDLVQRDQVRTVIVGFTDHFGRLLGKRFDAEIFLESVWEHGTHACDYLLANDMEMTPVSGYRFANWVRGYGDFHLVPDPSTLRLASWLEKTALVLCDVKSEKTGQLLAVAPRSMLRRQLERAEELSVTSVVASELEYYLFRDSYRDAALKGYAGLEEAGWYSEDYHILQGTRNENFTAAVRQHLKSSGVPVESSKGEFGTGQHELNVRHAGALEMADRHVVYKQCLKEVAEQMGMSVSFMAKLASTQAGSSCHIHLSLWRDGLNAFAGDEQFGPVKCSSLFRRFLGGWIGHASEVMVFYAPTVNSYKRYVEGSWAPTRLAWSHDNRTAGFRVVGKGQSLRIECRIPGADCNPYHAFAAALASGLNGVAEKVEPPECISGDLYGATDVPRVPKTLAEAVALFANSAFAKQAFGEEVVEHYAHFFRTEQNTFNSAVTDWERRRYFERI